MSQLRSRIRTLEVLCKCKLPNHFHFTFFFKCEHAENYYTFIMSYRAQEHYREKKRRQLQMSSLYFNGKQVIEGILLKREFQLSTANHPFAISPSVHFESSTQPSWLISTSFILSPLRWVTLLYTSKGSTL